MESKFIFHFKADCDDETKQAINDKLTEFIGENKAIICFGEDIDIYHVGETVTIEHTVKTE